MQLVIATEEEKRSRDPLTHAAWGQRLTAADYGRREERLRAHRWPREAMTTWLWKGDDGGILASCESFRMVSELDGAPGETFAIASVFTEERLRGSGHALALMRALGDELQRRASRAQAVILFSEVGATLYGRAGYEPLHLHDRIFTSTGDGGAPGGARYFAEAEIEEALAGFSRPAARFVVWPDAAQIDWHLERSRIYAETMGRALPASCGVALEGARALWAADFKNERLAVLLAEARDERAAAALVAAARREAARTGLQTVRIWETPSLPLAPDAGERVSRDADALPMLLPLTPGLHAADWSDVPRALWV